MIWLVLIVLIGGAFAIAVIASDAQIGPSDRSDDAKRKDLPPDKDAE
ncbi:hypothetical protein [Hyphomicrobium sp. LHD-15]|nr:hypothetical protein [Hyphomicrobium sp. LHD-15]MDQ8697736.1 hypothetical protein [Hyphomicrobium sp. LHD-15]